MSPTPMPLNLSKKKKRPTIFWSRSGCGCLGCGTVGLGILIAIALPYVLIHIDRIRASKPITILTAFNRAQQVYQLENQEFSGSLEEFKMLSYGDTFKYEMVPTDLKKEAILTAAPLDTESPRVKSYTGFIFLVDAKTNKVAMGICRSLAISHEAPVAPEFPNPPEAEVICPLGSERAD